MSEKPQAIIALCGGPLDSAILAVPADTKWVWIRVRGEVTINTQFAAWPHDDPPTRRPSLPPPLACYRLARRGAVVGATQKAEFEWVPEWSDQPDGQEPLR